MKKGLIQFSICRLGLGILLCSVLWYPDFFFFFFEKQNILYVLKLCLFA